MVFRPMLMMRHNRLLSNLLAYGASEAAGKASRLLVVVAVARSLAPEDIGLAAAALAFSEILKSLTENGIGQRIIAAPASSLSGTCRRAYQLFWIWCIGLALLQGALAALLAIWGSTVVAIMVAVLAIEYLLMPGGLVQAALAMREGKLKACAAIAGVQIVGANLLSVLLAFVWPSPWVLVLPKVLSAPLWLIAMRRLRPWSPDLQTPMAPLRPFLRFALPVLGIEGIKALRLHADKLLVGALLGAEGLGLYFMAFNAGLGIATAYITALGIVLFPHLASENSAAARKKALRIALLCITPLVLLQSLLAPLYVPLLLGADWAALAPVVSTLCLAAIPLTLWTVNATALRVAGRPEIELTVTGALTLALLLSTLISAPFGLQAMGQAYLATTALMLTLAAWITFPKTHPQQRLEA